MRFLSLFILSLAFSLPAFAQIELKTEYIGSTTYKDLDGNKTDGKGSAITSSLMAQIPLSVKMNENKRPTLWAVGLGGSYTSLHNKRIARNVMPREILNIQIGATHLRPISKNWSMMLAVGTGSYTAHAKLGDIKMTNILMSGSALFIWHLKDNLSLGGGISVNSSFGYPMVFPSFYLQWQLRGKYEVNIQLVDAVELSAGVNFSNKFKLKLIGSMSGSLALEKIEGEKMMFMHQYMIVGLQPELTLGKFSIPVTLGANVVRMARYKDRKLKAMFNNKDEKSNFDVAPYGSIALRYNF